MTFTNEQMGTLEKYERHFRTAIGSRYAVYPGSQGVTAIHEIYCSATGRKERLNASCSSCIFRLLVDCGTIYFKDKAELEQLKNNKPKKTRKK